jgi:hypothetical protein
MTTPHLTNLELYHFQTALDAAVLEAYGWPRPRTDDEILDLCSPGSFPGRATVVGPSTQCLPVSLSW